MARLYRDIIIYFSLSHTSPIRVYCQLFYYRQRKLKDSVYVSGCFCSHTHDHTHDTLFRLPIAWNVCTSCIYNDHTLLVQASPGPRITTAIWHCHKLGSQWKCIIHLNAALALAKSLVVVWDRSSNAVLGLNWLTLHLGASFHPIILVLSYKSSGAVILQKCLGRKLHRRF